MYAKTCCFTGHRTIRREDRNTIAGKLDAAIHGAIQSGANTFLSGGALGFDMLAAKLVLRRRHQGAAVQLVLVLPCQGQERFWSAEQREDYRHIVTDADAATYIAGQYHDGCMKERNRQMVARSDLCIAYLRDERSGTGQTVRMAEGKGIPIIKL